MQFSLRRLLGFMTLGCVAFAAAITFAPQKLNPPDLVKSVLIVILVVETYKASERSAADNRKTQGVPLRADSRCLGCPLKSRQSRR